MTQGRDAHRLRVIIACYYPAFDAVRDAIKLNFREEYRCSCYWCPLGCSTRDIEAGFQGQPGTDPNCIDVMLAIDAVNDGNPQNNRPWHTDWLDKAPAGVWRLFIDTVSTVHIVMMQRLLRMTSGRDILACMMGADTINDVTRDVFVRLLSYIKHS
jgi:hypothetical protein